MLLMNISGLDASTSLVNERVQIELENMLDEFEEKKIQHERTRRDELKKFEQGHAKEKKRIQEEAQKDVEYIKAQLEKNSSKDKETRVSQRRA